MKNIDHLWDDVRTTLDEAVAITYDGCHKIYIIMDDATLEEQISWGYEPISVDDPDLALAIVRDWFDTSCFLRFVSAVSHIPEPGNPNDGYDDLIPQGAEDDEEDE